MRTRYHEQKKHKRSIYFRPEWYHAYCKLISLNTPLYRGMTFRPKGRATRSVHNILTSVKSLITTPGNNLTTTSVCVYGRWQLDTLLLVSGHVSIAASNNAVPGARVHHKKDKRTSPHSLPNRLTCLGMIPFLAPFVGLKVRHL